MSKLTKYILTKYIKNFLIVLLSLEVFFVGMDFLQNFKFIPNSANLQLLYIIYTSFFTLILALPLSIVFAWIVTLIIFIRNNEFVMFYALGARRKDIFLPIITLTILLITLLIFLQMTPLAYSYEQMRKIVNNEYFVSTKNDIFLKYNEYFVYFQKLLPIEQKAENIHIYKIEDNDVVETIVAQKAYFQNNRWYIIDANIISKPKNLDKNAKLIVKNEKFLYTLEGFEPKILNNVYEGNSNYSLVDAFNTWILLSKQGVNTNKIRASIYNHILAPFFIVPLLFLIFAYASLNSRFFHLGKFISFGVFGTLVIWGLFFFLFKITSSGVVIPELSIVASLIVWFTISFYLYVKKIQDN